MLVKKHWVKNVGNHILIEYTGWFLFGFIPLYLYSDKKSITEYMYEKRD